MLFKLRCSDLLLCAQVPLSYLPLAGIVLSGILLFGWGLGGLRVIFLLLFAEGNRAVRGIVSLSSLFILFRCKGIKKGYLTSLLILLLFSNIARGFLFSPLASRNLSPRASASRGFSSAFFHLEICH